MSYPFLTIQQARQLPDLKTVMVSGRIRYSGSRVYLEQADHSLRLVGQPYSGLLEAGMLYDVWGELLPGKPPVLLVHDARPTGDTIRQPQITPHLRVDTEMILPSVRVSYHADEQVATTPDGHFFVLHGEELAQHHYALQIKVSSLNPPTLMVVAAVPISLMPWPRPGTPA